MIRPPSSEASGAPPLDDGGEVVLDDPQAVADFHGELTALVMRYSEYLSECRMATLLVERANVVLDNEIQRPRYEQE